MAQLKDGTVVNGIIEATLFDGPSASSFAYEITSLSSIDLNTQTGGMYKVTNGVEIECYDGTVSIPGGFTVLITSLDDNVRFQTLIDTNNNVYRRIYSTNSYLWKKL